MMFKAISWGFLVATIWMLMGCGPSEADQLLRQCEEADAKGDIDNAQTNCSLAAEKGSSAAKDKLKTIQPKYDALQAEQRAKRAKEAEERQKAADAERAARLAILRRKVSAKWWGDEADGECQAKGLPPYRVTYEGGLYAENEFLALSDRCAHLFRQRSEPSINDNIFCCPGR